MSPRSGPSGARGPRFIEPPESPVSVPLCALASDATSRQRLRSASRRYLVIPPNRLSTLDCRSFLIAGLTIWISVPLTLHFLACDINTSNSFPGSTWPYVGVTPKLLGGKLEFSAKKTRIFMHYGPPNKFLRVSIA